MPKVSVYNQEGQPVGEIELSDTVFGAEVNEPLLHQAVVMYLANQRQGTASTKTRGEVRGGGRKPWRQKGLGRARHGSIRSPIWVGGGVVFGPK
ncbi:MAG: 50S ribosomal protein L4, partial [Limnochordales bacterium]